jgi:hypothetical protein
MPTLERAKELLAKFKLKNDPWKTTFQVYDIEGSDVLSLTAHYHCLSRDGDFPIEININNFGFSVSKADSDRAFLRLVRNLAAFIAVHELDENFYVDGERVFEPHPKEGMTNSICVCTHPCNHYEVAPGSVYL